jgi:HlyD family secretion protein
MKTSDKGFFLKLCLLLAGAFFLFACKWEKTVEIPIGKAVKGTFYLNIYEEGEIEAVQSTNISAPNLPWQFALQKITRLVKDGSEVKAGDTLVVFDQSEVKKGIREAEARLEISKAELEKLTAQQQADLEEQKVACESARISQQIAKIKFESSKYESKIGKRQIQLDFEKANIALDRAKEQIDNKEKIQKEEIKQKNLSIDRDKAMLQEANETLKKLVLVSPTSGIAIIGRSYFNGNKYQPGEQCYSGWPIIQLPDLSALKATAKINEVDISKIKKGLNVEIKPDAFSESVYSGKVISVANLAVRKDEKSKAKVFPVEILINKSDKKLLPGLNVSCRIIVGKIKNALYVPVDAIHSEGAVNYVLKKTDKGFEKKIVKTSADNADYVVITAGLEVDDKVALADPFVKEEKGKKKTEALKEKKI